MEEAKVKRSLDVFWNDRIIGRYNLLEDGAELFSYDGDYLASPEKIGGSDSINSILSGLWRKFAQGIGVSHTALRSRIAHLCEAVTAQTSETLDIPQECENVLAIVKERADKLKEYAN